LADTKVQGVEIVLDIHVSSVAHTKGVWATEETWMSNTSSSSHPLEVKPLEIILDIKERFGVQYPSRAYTLILQFCHTNK
jgi:hypothetical protein